jgi:hypothetical protein
MSDLTTWDKQLLGEAGIAWAMSSALLSATALMTKVLQATMTGDMDTITQLSEDMAESMQAEQLQIGERRRIISRVLAKVDIEIRVPDIDMPGTTAID